MASSIRGAAALLERGQRRPPRPEILKRIADTYEVPVKELMVAAGYLEEGPEEKSEKQQVEQAFQYAINDPGFKFGTRLKSAHVPFEVKRFVAEMYQQATGRNLVKHS